MTAVDPERADLQRDEATRWERGRSRLARRWTELSPEQRQRVLDELFFEGPELVPYLWRFATLMALSVIIASLGLIGNSAAVVIGAMLVAPLMTPILALGAALAMAWPRRQAASALLVLAGCVGGIAIAWGVSALTAAERSLELSQELVARTQPTLLDLGIGIAAGAAGAYVTVRSKAAAAVPGVAIAVALVPPLATVGILMQRGEGRLAGQALLLLLTNLVTIVLAAAVVFLLTGFIPGARAARLRRRIRIGMATALIGVLAVAYPLGKQGSTLLQRAKQQRELREGAEQWIAGRDLEVVDATIERTDPPHLTLELTGADSPPPTRPLAQTIADRIGVPVELTVRYTPRLDETVRVSPGAD